MRRAGGGDGRETMGMSGRGLDLSVSPREGGKRLFFVQSFSPLSLATPLTLPRSFSPGASPSFLNCLFGWNMVGHNAP